MPTPAFYRYFLGCRPDPNLYPAFLRIAREVGQSIRLDLLHLTFCVIAEVAERDCFWLSRVRTALAGERLHSFPVHLSRVVGGPHGAEARTFGRQDALQDFYRTIVRQLRAIGIEPLHRKSGLHPHITLGYGTSPPRLEGIAIEWFPAELLLIESEVGLSRHNVLGRWPLLPPRQGLLPFDTDASIEFQSPATRLTIRQLPLREAASRR